MTKPDREARAAARHLVRLLAATSPEGLAAGGRMVVDLDISPAAGTQVRVDRIRVLARDRGILHDGPGPAVALPDEADYLPC